ncbi:hypothetical protein EZS27_005046 [termite gut metagenome]|uniref:Endonuclease GajA/Old nuclease/RecF-like AAA domain-containing protein n=1 Tax=termite gut metagenome TaxID=433724 RepID=A0A5J4SQ15_9ZZZZ
MVSIKQIQPRNDNVQSKQFSVVGLRILNECDSHLRKIVTPGYYFFNEWYKEEKGEIVLSKKRIPEENFFGKNISIQAIVGKNGSGKSSILDLIYRIINNFGYMLVRQQKRNAAEHLYFIEGLYADLYFAAGDTLGILSCIGNYVSFKYGQQRILFSEKREAPPSDLSNFKDGNKIGNSEIIEIAKSFFYTIVTNYSLQSFIDFDYKTECSGVYKTKDKSGVDSSAIWINSLFQKNDGYITPIVLNPYRNSGVMDLGREYQLTNYRLSAILIEAKRSKKQFIDEYKLHSIEYKYEPLMMLKKYEKAKKYIMLDDLIRDFLSAYVDKGISSSFTSIILESFGIKKLSPSNEEPYIISCIYLVYKTLSIASKYPSYNDYEYLGKIENYNKKATKEEEIGLKNIVRDIVKDQSHITRKIRQSIRFLECNLQNLTSQSNCDFTYDKYIQSLSLKKTPQGLEEIMEYLPPPFFIFNIKLDKIKRNKIISKEPILFQRMSSGERQFIYAVSTLVYHIKNVLSIQQAHRIRYRNINLILDEVEICFHPEYQRKFVDNLIRTIQRLHLNTHCSFNIIIATHSPFILSDIPMSNILYLDEGKKKDKTEFINPFGANINDILKQSFFLENGFLGEFARNKIKSLLEILTKHKNEIKWNNEWNENTSQDFIELIGEPIIKELLQSIYNEKFGIKDDKNKEIERLNKEIELLKARQ